VAVLRDAPPVIDVDLIRPAERALHGEPTVPAVAGLCRDLAADAGARLILIDGPQAWRASASPIMGKRLCEHCTHTPGKTGVPGVVKPPSWTRMAKFSVSVFDALHEAGWPRFSGVWPVERAAVESFPTQGWRGVGFRCLPAKTSRAFPMADWTGHLTTAFGVRWPRRPHHDELQAVVAGVGGLLLLRHGVAACDVHGREPFVEDDVWREGFILGPAAGARAVCARCGCGG